MGTRIVPSCYLVPTEQKLSSGCLMSGIWTVADTEMMLHSWYNKGIRFSGNWLNTYQLALSRFTYLKIINYSYQTYWNKYSYRVSIKLFILLGCTGSMSSRPYVYSSAAQHFPSIWEASWTFSLRCYRNITIVSEEGQIATYHSANVWAFPSQNNFFFKALEIKTSAHFLQFPRDWL